MAPTRSAKSSRQHESKSSQFRPWTSEELQRLIDAVAEGKSYAWIEANQTERLRGKPLRSAVELREALELDGAAHEFFWDMPIYWAFSKEVEDTGETEHNQDISPLNNDEEEELVLFLCRGMKNIDPNQFKIKRSSAFLNAQLERMARAGPTYMAEITVRTILQKRSLQAQLKASADATTTRMQGARTLSEAQQPQNSDETEYNPNETPELDETSDDEIDDPPRILTPRPPAAGHTSRLNGQITDFCRRWIQRPASRLDDDKEDRYFIKHARR
ncbi:MAG: hypothetical protein LQ350_005941 [Teloschistes chrysophthalmus]|nr:MAG: hypothetical protein LQ350_005941 [Niorma chrysophthalma]